MSDYRRSEIVSGLFVALAAVVFALFGFKVGRFDLMGLFKADAVPARAHFLDIKTLQVGSKVRVGGRNIGEVSDLKLVDGPAPAAPGSPASETQLRRLVNEVSFELRSTELRLDPETARVTIAQESLLSPHFLKLDPGRWPAGQPPQPIFEASLPDDLRIASVEGAGIEDLLSLAGPAIGELTSILRTVNREVLTPESMSALARVLGGLDRTLEESYQAIATLNREVLSSDHVTAVDHMIHNLDQAVANGQAVTARLDELLDAERDPRLDSVLSDLAALTGELRSELAAVSGDLRRVLDSADRVLGSTETELVESTRRLRRTLWQGEMALRKIRANPALLFFGDDETDLEARDFDMTDIRLRGRARPYEQRDERDDKN